MATSLLVTFLLCAVTTLPAQVLGRRPARDQASSQPALVRLRHATPLTAVAFEGSGKRVILAAYAGRSASIFDARTGARTTTLHGHEREVRCAAWSGGERRLVATGSLDETIRLFESDSGKPAGVLRGHENGIYSVTFSPDGRYLASSGFDNTMRLWDVAGLRLLRTDKFSYHHVAFSPDGGRLAYGEHRIRFRDVATGSDGRRRDQIDVPGNHAASRLVFSRDGALLAALIHDTRCHSQSELALYDIAGRERRPLRGDLHARHVAFPRDGRTLVTAYEREISGRDLGTGNLRFSRTVAPEHHEILALSPNGDRFLAAVQARVRRSSVVVGPVALSASGR